MQVLDGINHSGKVGIWFAGQGVAPEWLMKRELLSPAYTGTMGRYSCSEIDLKLWRFHLEILNINNLITIS